MAAFLLPSPIQRRAEAMLRDLLTSEEGPAFDFSSPQGEPALVSHHSVSWRVFSNPVTLFVGGVAAVLLEFGEPRVRHGVWDNSSFRRKPLERLQRTGLAAMMTVFGPATAARAMIEHVNRAHGQIKGTTAGGEAYRADDPELLRWVQTTASFGFVEAYRRFAVPLSDAQLDAYYVEAAPIAALYGSPDSPRNEAERAQLFDAMRAKLEPSATIDEFLAIMMSVPALPRAGRPAQRLLVRAAVDILPGEIRGRLKLERHRLRPWERPLVRALAKAGARLILRSSPAVQACRRLGLPDDWLYTTGSVAMAGEPTPSRSAMPPAP